MLGNLENYPIIWGFFAGIITWIFTSVGAAAVFFKQQFSQKSMDILLGFAAGVMLAASFWSLLNPALDIAAQTWGEFRFIPLGVGFLTGAAILRLLDYILPHIHPILNKADGPQSALPRSILLIFAITLHNIPEAIAVGVAFGAVSVDPSIGYSGAITLMLGIGLQNMPEGMAVSLPLLREGISKKRAFFYGQLSGLVEPFAAITGAALASIAFSLLPWALSFAAGAMIFVCIEEVIPEAHASSNGDSATMGAMLGFVFMMCLDIAFA